MKKLLLFLLALPLILQLHTAWAASSPDVTVQILPMDCMFEIVQDGLNTITYLTPAECGQALPPQGSQTPAEGPGPSPLRSGSRLPLIHDIQAQPNPTSAASPSAKPASPPNTDQLVSTRHSLKTALAVASGILAAGTCIFGLARLILTRLR